MEPIFYLDLYFFINFSLDALGFFIASRILLRPIRLLRFLGAAFVGASYACIAEIIPLSLPIQTFLSLLTLFLCVLLLFPPRGRRDFFRSLLYTALSLALLGGGLIALQSLLGTDTEKQSLNAVSVLLLCTVSFGVIVYCKRIQNRFSRAVRTICMHLNHTACHATALIDSGNLLIHPRTGYSAALISQEAADALFGNTLTPNETILIATPAGTAELKGFVVTETYIRIKSKPYQLQPFFLAIDPNSKHFGGCDMLISPTILPAQANA